MYQRDQTEKIFEFLFAIALVIELSDKYCHGVTVESSRGFLQRFEFLSFPGFFVQLNRG